MGVDLKVGGRYRSAVCATEIVVVRCAAGLSADLRCGGAPVIGHADPRSDAAPMAPFDGGTVLGKRYVDPDLGLEILCSKGGDGALSIGDVVLLLKDAKPLPSSD
jgi:hypothetical protein